MNAHQKKMIAPVVISILFELYYALYFGVLIALLDGVFKYALGILPLLLSAVMISVCLERIREIKEGEEDDLGQY